MDYSGNLKFELGIDFTIDKEPWESDAISLMTDQLLKYKDIAGGALPEKYLHPVKRLLSGTSVFVIC